MRKMFIVSMFVFAFVLSACGPKKATLDITANEWSYDSSTYTVPSGAEVTVNMTNNGVFGHVFSILKKGEHVTLPFKSEDESKILWEIAANPRKTKSGSFTAPTEPGEYDILCRIHGHAELGMKATLIVKDK
jgi:plastocyanin